MNPEYVLLGGLFWRLMGKTVFMWYAHKHGSRLRTIALWLAHRVISVSKESFVEHDSPKFIPIGHGIDVDLHACPARTPSGGKKEILTVGRLSPVKECAWLVEAAGLLRRNYGRNDFYVRFIGGPANPEDEAYVRGLKSRADGLGLHDEVHFDGPIPNKDVPETLCRADIFVSMQCAGGAGKSFLEAMAARVPTVVCTPVFNDDLGRWKPYLFFGGTPEDLAEKLDRCLSMTDEERSEMGAVLRGIVERDHNLKNLVRRVRDEYLHVRH
jgi:glycosyltransferase involved in cell wall biosynthesis